MTENMRTEGRRLVKTRVGGEVLGLLCREGVRGLRIESELPDFARFFGAYYDDGSRCFMVIFEDDSFEEVPSGKRIPFVDVEPTVSEFHFPEGVQFKSTITGEWEDTLVPGDVVASVRIGSDVFVRVGM